MATDAKAIRRYNATVERALALFDPTSEWADYIAFLSRLHKALDTGRPEGLHEVPAKQKVALCLSRCLQASLPSGVHQKALEVYAEVFVIFSSEGLSQNLALFLPGISHASAFVSLATRPMLLDLYDKYLLQLPTQALRPALKAVILSLLPVIEEENSEDFEQCLQTFDSIRSCFAKDGQEYFFWQMLFVASISNSSRRAGVLVYLQHYLPKLTASHVGGDEKSGVDLITTPEPGLLVRCFATGLRNDQALIARGFLDLLVSHMPLHASVLQSKAYQKDLDILVWAALSIVLRRDMSLNRRLWSWLTGIDAPKQSELVSPISTPSKGPAIHSDYFSDYGRDAVIRCIQSAMVDEAEDPTPHTLPFRIMLSLMDRWEIGGPVVIATFARTMSHLSAYQSTAPSQQAFDEVFRSANVFFDAIDSTTLFKCLEKLLDDGQYNLIVFIINNFNIDQSDEALSHICRLTLRITDEHQKSGNDKLILRTIMASMIELLPATSEAKEGRQGSAAMEARIKLTETLLNALSQSEESPSWPVLCFCFERIMIYSPKPTSDFSHHVLDQINKLHGPSMTAEPENFALLDAKCRVLICLLQYTEDDGSKLDIMEILPTILAHLWQFLDARTPQFHVAVADYLWKFEDITTGTGIVESCILQQLSNCWYGSDDKKANEVQRFGILYHHARTIKRAKDEEVPEMLRRAALQMVDMCKITESHDPYLRWLTSLYSISPLLNTIFDSLSSGDRVLVVARINKVMEIVALSEDQWHSFVNSPDLKLIHDFSLDLIESSISGQWEFARDGYSMLRKLYDGKSKNSPPPELVTLLVSKLDDDGHSTQVDHEVLDTLLAILNEKSLLPPELVRVLLDRFPRIPTSELLDKWITLLCNFLPNHGSFLANLLKITSNFCERLQQVFDDLEATFGRLEVPKLASNPERTMTNLLSGLEYVLARAHQMAFDNVRPNGTALSGHSEAVSSRAKANDRLTVILCMQDAVRTCAELWTWKTRARSNVGDSRSFQYTATKLRNRSRKMLEHLIEAESQECLETLIGSYVHSQQGNVLELLQTLNGARPRVMMPTIFQAIHSRSVPGGGSAGKSSRSIDLDTSQLVAFLNDYTKALEDDMLEEIWSDCASFMKQVLANPMPHRQILLKIVRFCSLLAQKMENTNFSEETQMYRELTDICARLLTAIFTIKPGGLEVGQPRLSLAEKNVKKDSPKAADALSTLLVETLPALIPLFSQYDRSNTVLSTLSTNVITPAMHSRNFPLDMNEETLRIMKMVPSTSKSWKRDLSDAFNHSKFFQNSIDLVPLWLSLLRQLQNLDRSVVTEVLNRLTPPAAAGLVLGIGANAARTEADRRTQLDVRRLAVLLLANEHDASLQHLPLITEKIEELFTATSESSPSLASRGDVYILIRTLLLTFDSANLAHLWPILENELRQLCEDIISGKSIYTDFSKIQGAKLLDLLLSLRPDDFQMHEWLFVTDTIDAIYPTEVTQNQAFADEISKALVTDVEHYEANGRLTSNLKRPWFTSGRSRETSDANVLLAEFFGHLSIRAFEDLYSLQPLDIDSCRLDLIADIFSDSS